MSRSLTTSAFLGNFFEHYDTALFSFLSPFLAPLIFPEKDPLTALILTYALIPLGMLARPFGSLVFGYIGDNYGRKKALVFTFSGMSIVSFMIAFSPTYASAGLLAPLIFCIGRILQNFCAAGESVGGAIFLLENHTTRRHDFLSSLYSASTIGGILAASLSVSWLYYSNFLQPGWRLLYLFGGLMTLIVCFMRSMQENNNFLTKKQEPYNLLEVINLYKFKLLLIMISTGFSYANYCMALILMNGLIPLITPYSSEKMMGMNTALLALDFIALPFFGWLSDKIGREKLMLGSCLAIILTSLPLFLFLKGASLVTIIGIRILFVLFGVAFAAPLHAWLQQLLPPYCRYVIISLGYALGSQLFGGPTVALSLWVFQKTGSLLSIPIYWISLALVCFIVLFLHFVKRGATQKTVYSQ